jgi:hypothetical protein
MKQNNEDRNYWKKKNEDDRNHAKNEESKEYANIVTLKYTLKTEKRERCHPLKEWCDTIIDDWVVPDSLHRFDLKNFWLHTSHQNNTKKN